jgi:hypothetical protein
MQQPFVQCSPFLSVLILSGHNAFYIAKAMCVPISVVLFDNCLIHTAITLLHHGDKL